MTANPWGKFFWNDWENDPALRLCSLAAQGLWIRLLCIAAKAEPTGYLIVAGRSPSTDDLSVLTGRPVDELTHLMDELDRNGVFSRDARGRIYSRRMVRDSKKAAIARKNGKRGGNPTLCKQTENTASDKGQVNGWDKTHKPEARFQSSESKDSGAQAPPAVDVKKAVYDTGKAILGDKAGGAITKAIAAVNVGGVAEILDHMRKEQPLEPMPYFQRCVRERVKFAGNSRSPASYPGEW